MLPLEGPVLHRFLTGITFPQKFPTPTRVSQIAEYRGVGVVPYATTIFLPFQVL